MSSVCRLLDSQGDGPILHPHPVLEFKPTEQSWPTVKLLLQKVKTAGCASLYVITGSSCPLGHIQAQLPEMYFHKMLLDCH